MSITLCSLLLCACNNGSSGTSTFNAVNPDNGVVSKITNINYEGVDSNHVVYNNSAVLNAASLVTEVTARSNNVILSDKSGYDSGLWIFDNNKWNRQTGGVDQPPSVITIYSVPNPNSLVIRSKTSKASFTGAAKEDIWTYDGSHWKQQTGGINQPPTAEVVYGAPTPSSIILLSKAASNSGDPLHDPLWVYNGRIWSKQSGGSNQPPSVGYITDNSTANSIVLVDDSSLHDLWTFNGSGWTRLSGSAGQPQSVKNIFGERASPDFIVLTDSDSKLWVYTNNAWSSQHGWNNAVVDWVYSDRTSGFFIAKDSKAGLWLYDGKSWSAQSGGPNQPKQIDNILGRPSLNSIVLRGTDSSLWVYNGKSWQQQIGGVNQPRSISRIFGQPTESSIVLLDNEQQDLWVYDGKSWAQQTSLANQPKAVNAMFMAHQRELQQ